MKNKQSLSKILVIVFTLLLILQACKPDDHNHNHQETITTLHVVATQTVSGIVSTFTFRDLDGNGPNAPVLFDSIVLDAGKSYNVSLVLLDETKSPVDSVSNEVLKKGTAHLFSFSPTPTNLITATITDRDVNNKPIGLRSTWATGTANTGKLNIILHHDGNKDNIAAKPGETDIDVTFPVRLR